MSVAAVERKSLLAVACVVAPLLMLRSGICTVVWADVAKRDSTIHLRGANTPVSEALPDSQDPHECIELARFPVTDTTAHLSDKLPYPMSCWNLRSSSFFGA